ncbi:hypothetical protein PSM7751_00033 [Pseudooceanicola marinus]|uniref:DUF983 domain-containing protein n=1 Tax=Pseudooceanicola marinus TaxID=396013 RepID=A0A1X6Y407_9RHOB|nr:hypothetical protein PSM7751_00033 [Pseudooceanicola marinus]
MHNHPDQPQQTAPTAAGPAQPAPPAQTDAADPQAQQQGDGNAPRRSDRPEPRPERPLKPALRRGWRRRCPNCGSGPLMKGFLKVRDHCPVCRETFSHHRADDGPAYLTILIVGHLSAPLMGSVWMAWQPEPLVLFTVFAIGTVALSLYLLPRLKGAMVAFQWARYMHGFGAGGA